MSLFAHSLNSVNETFPRFFHSTLKDIGYTEDQLSDSSKTECTDQTTERRRIYEMEPNQLQCSVLVKKMQAKHAPNRRAISMRTIVPSFFRFKWPRESRSASLGSWTAHPQHEAPFASRTICTPLSSYAIMIHIYCRTKQFHLTYKFMQGGFHMWLQHRRGKGGQKLKNTLICGQKVHTFCGQWV